MEANVSFIGNPDLLPWLVPLGPLLAFFIITLITNRAKIVPATSPEYSDHNHPGYFGLNVGVASQASRAATIIVGLSGIIAAWLIALSIVGPALNTQHFGEEVFGSSFDWLATGETALKMGVLVDPLNTLMLIMVPLACVCIFIYSIGYMASDARQSRFFALISLFAGAMLTLVVADNLLLLFVGWEVMGLCSYLLIGFWFEKESAYKAAIKAFTTTRVADVIMLLGIVYLYSITGTLSFREIMHNQEVLDLLANTPALVFGGMSAASLIGIFLVIGTIGKSAQFPLHVWLPDAMEGPTPVSAMIHAAAMVSAGIYAIIRMYPVFAAGGDPHHGVLTPPLLLMTVVGAFTALFAATIAVAQNDVKKVLAYSTISQLGFMMAALGIGAYIAAAFHLITHAFFKALLFMASGAVIHGMEHGDHHVHEHAHAHDDDDFDLLPAGAHALPAAAGSHGDLALTAEVDAHVIAGEHAGHDTHAHTDSHGHDAHGHDAHDEHGHAEHFDPQDMMNMGGLRKGMPVTFITFLIGGLSLAGFPLLTAGFWSKDEILAEAWLGLTEGFGPHALVFVMLAIAAFLTAFYTMRQLGLTFWGEPRTEQAKHANLGQGIVSATMTLPLIILAFFAIFAGFVGVHPGFPLFGAIFSPEHNPFAHFVGPTLLQEPPHPDFNIVPVLFSFAVALGGLAVGYAMYWRKPLLAGEPDPLVERLGGLYPVLKNKYYVDELYVRVFVKPSQWFSRVVVSDFVDRGIIDGFLHLLARTFVWIGDFLKLLNMWLIDGVGDGIPELIAMFGARFRRIQTGRIQQYMLFVAIAVILIALVFIVGSGILSQSTVAAAVP
ncbi:MAG: NADH-quinone oxidoreductase subunit L [Chloroflexi bacterium]|nr:NADH-quinone oxidoreductase subunit L [Chloroflexota bacterium]MCC6896720.1 NADH-quinone oxidoreductase subunit L [Anaerolineae bacterium]